MILESNHLQSSLAWRTQLLNWYDLNKRDFPWRRFISPYHTWVCEVMSQQTTMAVVVPRFNEFVAKLPNVHALAHASDEELRSLWVGLGYYARARHLRAGAQDIVNRRNGEFPQSYNEWLTVPGVGPYTASVLVSICLDFPKACVDGNVIRVVSRLTGTSAVELWSEKGKASIQSLVDGLIDPVRPGDFNQAMMELGALICRKQSPDCCRCPVQDACLASARNLTTTCPPNKPRAEVRRIQLAALVISSSDSVADHPPEFFLIERQEGFLSGTLGFPLIQHTGPQSLVELCSKLSAIPQVRTVTLHEANVRHTITRNALEVGQIRLTCDARTPQLLAELSRTVEQAQIAAAKQTWVSKKLVSRRVSTALDLKVWEKFS